MLKYLIGITIFDTSMKYLIAFWGIWFIVLLITIFRYKSIVSGKHNNILAVTWIVAFAFLVMAIITNDPVFQSIGLPKEYEWLAGLLTTGFTGWVVYLRPLKSKVYGMDREVGEIKTNVSNIKDSINEMKPYVMKKIR